MTLPWLGFSVLFLLSTAAMGEAPTIAQTLQLVGTGESFGGGDLRMDRLEDARKKITHALDLLSRNVDADTLCRPKTCSTKNELCRFLNEASDVEKRQCHDFLITNVGAFRQFNSKEQTPYILSSMPLILGKKKTGLRYAAAVTRMEPKGPVTFHYPSIEKFSEDMLEALIVHELGHKLKIDDETGRKLLDTAGAAIALYSADHPVPSQFAGALPEGVSEEVACRLVKQHISPFLVGASADVEKELPTEATLAERQAFEKKTGTLAVAQKILGSRQSHGRSVEKYFRLLLKRAPSSDEKTELTEKLATGETEASLVAAILGDEEYLRNRGAETQDRFLAALFEDLLGRAPTASEASFQAMSKVDKPTLAYLFLTKHEDVQRALISQWYKEYLNRIPNETELETKTSQLRSGMGWEVVKAYLIASPEYQALQRSRWSHCGT